CFCGLVGESRRKFCDPRGQRPLATGTTAGQKAIRWRYIPHSRPALADVRAGLSCCLPRDTMSLAGLLAAIADDPQFRRVADLASAGGGVVPVSGADVPAPAALRPFLAAALTGLPGPAARFLLAVTATAREAEELAGALSSLLPPGRVAYFPARETLPHERLSPRSDTSGQRLAVLRRLAHPDPASSRTAAVTAVVTPVRALLQ